MKLFLSYPSAERSTAERLALALEAEGHEVFFDRSDLDAGQAFHQPLREAIHAADAMVFLVTPAAVAPGSYTLAELDIARSRWRRPAGHVLPVLLAPTPIASLPPYLAAVTLLQPHGEPVAQTVAAVARLGAAGGRRLRIAIVAAVAVLVLAGAGAFFALQRQQDRAAAAALQRDEAAAAQAMQLCNDGSHEAALQQLVELAARQPPVAVALALRADCAMRWLREMRASRGDGVNRSFDQQVAVVQPVLLQALTGAQGARAADLRAHLGWGEYLRRFEGSGNADPVPHWQRALSDDAGNVYAHAMWASFLLRADLTEARRHFDIAVASGRDREFVRRLQFIGTVGSSDDATAYAVVVADAMRRGGEAVSAAQRSRLWTYAFGFGFLNADLRQALFAALPGPALLATFDWLFPAAEWRDTDRVLSRFSRATLQANAGDRAGAQEAFEALERELRAGRRSGRVLDQTQQALAALRKAPVK